MHVVLKRIQGKRAPLYSQQTSNLWWRQGGQGGGRRSGGLAPPSGNLVQSVCRGKLRKNNNPLVGEHSPSVGELLALPLHPISLHKECSSTSIIKVHSYIFTVLVFLTLQTCLDSHGVLNVLTFCESIISNDSLFVTFLVF